MVEFALVLPPLLLILTGLFSLGIVINQYEILTNAVSEGARAFALSRGQTIPAIADSDKCAYAIQTVETAAPTLDTSSLSFTITYTPAGGTATAYTGTCSGIVMHPTDTVQVSATYSVAPLIFGWGGRVLHINATTTAMVQ
jgi:Flp pilus assembly protein TadG